MSVNVSSKPSIKQFHSDFKDKGSKNMLSAQVVGLDSSIIGDHKQDLPHKKTLKAVNIQKLDSIDQ